MQRIKSNRVSIVLTVVSVAVSSFFLTGCLDDQRTVNKSSRKDDNVHARDQAVPTKNQCGSGEPAPGEDIFYARGAWIKVLKGDLYICDGGKWVYNQEFTRPGFKHVEIKKTANDCNMIDVRSGKGQRMTSNYSSDFEVSSFVDLFHTEGWKGMALQSPKASTVKEYVKLNKKIMKGGQFLDNRIDLESNNVHSGKKALRFYAVAPNAKIGTSKSLIEKTDLCFTRGDHLWFSGWYYIKEGFPATLVDFETRQLKQTPGMRLIFRKNKYASMELKHLTKPHYTQYEVPFPSQKWVHIKIHLWLSNRDDGIIEMWQDGKKILSTTGQTLPTYDTFYNTMQVGITAAPRKTVLLVDDIVISDKPL